MASSPRPATMVRMGRPGLALGLAVAVSLAAAAVLAVVLVRGYPVRDAAAVLAVALAAFAGVGTREIVQRLRDSAGWLRRAAAEHEAATGRAVEAERGRIAAELHDVVTHHVSMMVVQAGAARAVPESRPHLACELKQGVLAERLPGERIAHQAQQVAVPA
jgi:signal transduction histidine kinase